MDIDAFWLPPRSHVLSTTNLQRLGRLYNQLCEKEAAAGRKMSRRRFPDYMTDQLWSFEGDIFREDGSLLEVTDTCVDDAFNDDASFRALSRLASYDCKPPKRNRMCEAAFRHEIITATFIIDGTYPDLPPGWKNPFRGKR